MEMIQDKLLSYGVAMPEWLFWVIIAVVAVIVIAFAIFPKHLKKVTDKYDVPFETVDSMVKMMASLAIRLYVLRKGVQETNKIARIKNVALLIDVMYPKANRLRLSQLVIEVEEAMTRKFSGDELVKHQSVIVDLQQNIIKELLPVGKHINDNENDPMINPHEISKWIGKGVEAIDYVKK